MKRIFTLLIALLFVAMAFAQPVNDECAGAIHLGDVPVCDVNNVYSNVDATMSDIGDNNLPACFEGGIPDRDVWFSFTIPPGGLTDLSILIEGVGVSALVNPQVALYRGACGNLQELFCGTVGVDGNGQTSLRLDALGMFDNATYYLRINEFSGSATPNWGDFTLCVVEFVPSYNLGDDTGSTSCFGTLYDSGGEDDDYQNDENYTFTICPDDPHQCIALNLVEYHLEGFGDYLNLYAGNSTSAPLIESFSTGGGDHPTHLFASSDCVTVQFTSNSWVINSGFELEWMCSPNACDIPDEVSCEDPEFISTLPFAMDGLSTCYSGNNSSHGPCAGDDFLSDNEYVFVYNSSGNECIGVSVTGSNTGTGVGVYADCPETADSCYALSGGNFSVSEPAVNAVYLENPGLYYIVVGNAFSCTPFNITITRQDCPVTMPSAADCADALSLNSCGVLNLPAIVSVAPGEGDPDFLVDGVNDGCWGGFDPPNFTFFYFQAQADGNFGFIMEAANPEEASDIDFEVWGPIDDFSEACDYARTHEPARSSYAAGADPTGLADVHPVDGSEVQDTCEDAGGDDFVSTLPVEEGKFYMVLINDWGDQIVSGAISIDFGNTVGGVLDPSPGYTGLITQDTTTCLGDPVQLIAEGGEAYFWEGPGGTLSCTNCPNPIAIPTEPTTYAVNIAGVCHNERREITIDFFSVDAGEDLTVCRGEDFEINAGPEWSTATYSWVGIDTTMSCMDCPHPVITAPDVAGDYPYIVTLTGPSCAISDTMVLHVTTGVAPVFDVVDDRDICIGESLNLGGAHNPGYTYEWSSVPSGFVSDDANPMVMPTETTEYYLAVTSPQCDGITSYDSVTIAVYHPPSLNILPDTFICERDSIQMGMTIEEPGTTYSWTPATGLSNTDIANPMASPDNFTQYFVTATNAACTSTDSLYLNVVKLTVNIENPDSSGICLGTQYDLAATVFPTTNPVIWTPDNGTLSDSMGVNVTAVPTESTWYYATTSIDHCVHNDSIFIEVDSIPDLNILPQDTMICKGQKVTLTVPDFEVTQHPDYTIQWYPTVGLLTNADWFNAVVQPDTTTTYGRIYTGKFCKDTSFTTVIVIPEDVNDLLISNDTIVCSGSPVTLMAGFEEEIEGVFVWQPDGIAGDTVTVVPAMTTNYTVVFDGNNGCDVHGEASVLVTVIPDFNIDSISFNPDPAISGLDVTLTAHTTAELSGANYIWQANGDEIGTTSVNMFTTVAPEDVTAATYTVLISDSEDVCHQSASATVEVESPEAEFANIFSPNGDQKNDIFGAIVDDYDSLKYIEFKIYTRWGELVYDNTNPRGWDGRYKGKDVPADTYVYKVIYEYKGKKGEKKGDITLIR